jgi:nucleoside-diphosphate-sugar epimerase
LVDPERIGMMEKFLVTGAGGCIGSWAVANLIRRGAEVVAFDVSDDDHRLRLVLDDEDLQRVPRRIGDIRDLETVIDVVERDTITHIIHLAALQVPFCQADPVLGSQVNVTGTVNVLEATRRSDGRVRGVSYASSIAAFGPPAMYPDGTVDDDSELAPATLYGAYKQANEWTARVYAADWGIGSVGLRPSVIYGEGRDQGLTSDPTKAMVKVAAGLSAHIAFGGAITYQHASDAADYFIASALLDSEAALLHNIGGPVATMPEIVGYIEAAAPGAAGSVTFDDVTLPIPGTILGTNLEEALNGSVVQKPLADGIAGTVENFRKLIAEGLVSP